MANLSVDVKNMDVFKDVAECMLYAVSLLEGDNKQKALEMMASKGLVDIGK